MPKDNEVEEKVTPVAWIVTNGGESCEPWLEYEQSEVDALPAVCIAEPLYSAATVAELRAEVVTERLRGELDALEQFLRMAAEPIGQECCGDPIPVFAQPNEVFQAMSERHAEILASLATLTGADPT